MRLDAVGVLVVDDLGDRPLNWQTLIADHRLEGWTFFATRSDTKALLVSAILSLDCKIVCTFQSQCLGGSAGISDGGGPIYHFLA